MDTCFNTREMDTKKPNVTAEIRRKNLAALVKLHGLAALAHKVDKPDRQINDMIVGRKAFGEKVARAIEAAYDPDTPPGWLDVDAEAVTAAREAKAAYQAKSATPPKDAVSAADREILSRYHGATPETRAAVDLLLLSKTERNALAPSAWATIIAIEAQSLSALASSKKAGSKRAAAA